jgi:hypothetical protein
LSASPRKKETRKIITHNLNQKTMNNFKLIFAGAAALVILIMFIAVNPFSWNDGGNRTVVQQTGGNQFVRFAPGVFYAGFFSKETEWPNQISVMYQADKPNLELIDNGIEVGVMDVMFSDKITGRMKGIAQFVLPSDEKEMILIHNTHKTPQALVEKRLAPYTKECMQSAGQQMTADMHSSGGRAQMSQDFNQQLREGVVLLTTKERIAYDSIDKENKRVYESIVQLDKNGQPKRKISSIKEYGITIADAQITDVKYDDMFLARRSQLISAATKTAVSKSDLTVAQQKTLTAEAEGKQKLVEIEYAQKQEQTKQVVAAETKVEIAKQDLLQQEIQRQAAYKEADKIKTLADAEAYSKSRVMQADGALEKKLSAYIKVNECWAKAFSEYEGQVTPTFMMGSGSGGNAASNFMELMGAKAARDLSLELKTK